MTEVQDTASVKDDLYGSFLRDLGRGKTEILPREEINRKIASYQSPHTPQEIKDALKRELVGANFALIPYAIKHSTASSGLQISPGDLVGGAYETLIRCMSLYDPEKNGRFVTYALDSMIKRLKGERVEEKNNQVFSYPATLIS